MIPDPFSGVYCWIVLRKPRGDELGKGPNTLCLSPLIGYGSIDESSKKVCYTVDRDALKSYHGRIQDRDKNLQSRVAAGEKIATLRYRVDVGGKQGEGGEVTEPNSDGIKQSLEKLPKGILPDYPPSTSVLTVQKWLEESFR